MEMATHVECLFASARTGVNLLPADAEALAHVWRVRQVGKDADERIVLGPQSEREAVVEVDSFANLFYDTHEAIQSGRVSKAVQAALKPDATLPQVAFHSLLTETRFLEQCGDRPFSETVARLTEERVMRRHLWVALRKARHQGDFTFLIETNKKLIRLREKDGDR